MKTLTRFLLLLFLSIRFCADSYGQQNLNFEHLSIKDGLAGNTVYRILQDRKGYMWFATLNGLSRYDGYKFTNYTHRPHDSTSISQNTLFALYEDTQGVIWLGNTEGGICKFDPKTEHFTTYRPPQPKGLYVPALRAVSAISEDREGVLWVGTYGNELYSFDKKTGKFLHQYDLKKGKSDAFISILSIYKDSAGVLWVGSSHGLHRLNQNPDKSGHLTYIGFTHYLPEPTKPTGLSSSVSAIFEDHQGFLWIGTYGNGNGLNRFNPKTGVFTHYLNKPSDPFSISNNTILHITEDSQGNLWVGTLGGLNKLNPERTQFTRYLHDPLQPSSLGNNIIQSLYYDKSGILWVGTQEGISRWTPTQKPFRLYTHNPYDIGSLAAGSVKSIYEDKDGNLWIGTEILSKFNKQTGTFTHYQTNMLQLDIWSGINAIIEDHAGTFWVAINNQLKRFNPKTGKFSLSGSKLLDEQLQKITRIFSLYEDSDGLLWIATQLGVIAYDPKTGIFKQYKHDPHNPNSVSDFEATVIYGDSRGNIWIGQGSVALTRFNKRTGKFTWFLPNLQDTNSVSSNVVRSLYEDKQGNLWIGSVGGGLCRFDYKTEKFTTYAAKQGLTATEVSSILEDGNNNLWLGTDQGIFSFSLKTHTFKRYDASDGLQSNLFSKAAWRGSDGTLYMGGSEGFNAFDPMQIKPNTAIPPVVVTEFKLFDKPMLGKQEAKVIELNYDQNFFSFEFAALNFTNSHKNQYAYQLVGVDKDWVYSGTRRNVSYTDLPPGDYTFRVKASNNDGIWNEKGISTQVIILPPWWRTWWAYGFYALCCIIGGIALNRTMRQRLIAKEREKAKEKELAQAHEIEKAYKELKSTQNQLIQKEKLASLGELTAGIAHEIQNPLNFVNNFSELSVELAKELKEEIDKVKIPEKDKEYIGDIISDLSQNQEKINHHGKRASSIVSNMLEHSRTSTGERALTNINKLADEYLRLSYNSMRAKNKDFEADYELIADATLPLINVVPQDIGRVLLNLINNAFYAVSKQTVSPKVTVSTQKVPSEEGVRLDSAAGGWVQLKVTDNGSGIPADILPKIFQPFFTTKPTGEGTGLGLSLAYDIITKGHGGIIEVETKEGEGTTFIVKLPIQ